MTRKPFCYEPLLDSFRSWAKQQLEIVPEARGLALAVDWEVGANDFPPGDRVSREPTPAALLGLTRALADVTRDVMGEVAARAMAAQKEALAGGLDRPGRRGLDRKTSLRDSPDASQEAGSNDVG